MRRLAALVLVLLAGCGGSDGMPAETRTDATLGPLELVERLRDGGLVVYLRHAATDRSKDDAGVIELDDCSTQRNLNADGREQSRTIGEAFRALAIPVGDVLASEYCRPRETAELAFARATLEPDLTGFPNEGDPGYEKRVAATRDLLGTPPAEANTVLVAHIKNIEAAADVSIEEGEVAVFEPRGNGSFTYLGRIPASAWPQLVEELRP